jgi:hypothetical protein
MPIFAKIAVNAANRADSNAQMNQLSEVVIVLRDKAEALYGLPYLILAYLQVKS